MNVSQGDKPNDGYVTQDELQGLLWLQAVRVGIKEVVDLTAPVDDEETEEDEQ